jgi:hypothetical protein
MHTTIGIPPESFSTKTFCATASFHHQWFVARKCRVRTVVVVATGRGGVVVLSRNSLRSSHFAVAVVDTGLWWMAELRTNCVDERRMDPSFRGNEIRGEDAAKRLRGVGSNQEDRANPIRHCQNCCDSPPRWETFVPTNWNESRSRDNHAEEVAFHHNSWQSGDAKEPLLEAYRKQAVGSDDDAGC